MEQPSLLVLICNWQVELTEASQPLAAFTVGSLESYECVWMPFGLTDAPATF